MPAAKASNQSESVEKVTVEDTLKSAEKAKEEFSCDICDFTSNWANGLNIHMTRKHDKVEQLDGCVDVEEDDKYFSSKYYWKDGRIGTVFQTYLDVIDVIESSDLKEDDKQLEKGKALEARRVAFGTMHKFFPPWSTKWWIFFSLSV